MGLRYIEIIVDGPFDAVKGFVLGFLETIGKKSDALFAREHRIEHEGGFDHLLRLINLKEDRAHIIISKKIGRLLREAFDKRKDIKVLSSKEIVGAHFDFNSAAYTEEYGDELKGLFESLPRGIQIEGYELKEKDRPNFKGISPYSSEHRYGMKARGTISGPVKEVIDFYDKIKRYEMMELGEIKLELKDLKMGKLGLI